MKAIIIVLALALSGCATINPAMQSKEAAVACQVADALTTAAALSSGAVEANPLMAGLIKSFGIPGLILIKAAVAYLLTSDTVDNNTRLVVSTLTCGVAAANLRFVVQ